MREGYAGLRFAVRTLQRCVNCRTAAGRATALPYPTWMSDPRMIAFWSTLFAAVLLLTVTLKLWLSARQMRFVTRNAATVPAQFAATIDLADHQRAAAYTIAKQRLGMAGTVLGALAFVCLTWGGALQWLAAALAAWTGTGFFYDLAFVALVAAVLGLLDLPLEWISTFRVEARFGFNRMSQAMFFTDALKSLLVGGALGLPVLAVVLLLMRAAGPAWWLAVWLFWSAFSLLLGVVYPWLIAPLFNRFTPLVEGPLYARIGALLARTGFRSNGVYTMDGSRRSAHGNAYFTGLGAAKRIVFYDTLVARLGVDEIEAVLAHELGHFRLHHVAKSIASGLAASLAWLALLGWLQTQAWFAPSLGVVLAPGLPANGLLLVLFALVMPMFSFVLAPVRSALSRKHEFEADAFAAQHASAQSLVHALVKLYQDNAATLTPDPLHSAFYDSHPPASIRIDRLLARAPAASA
jgi:STE24 endopeptidase